MEGAALSAPKYLGHDGACPAATALCRREKSASTEQGGYRFVITAKGKIDNPSATFNPRPTK